MPAATLERINQAAESLGYTPNRSAQALKTNRTMTIACIVPDITNPFYPALMRGVQSVTDAHGYDVIAVNTDASAEREQHFLEWSRQGRVDGIVGVFFTLRAPDFAPLVNAGLSVVRIESARKPGGQLAIDDLYVDSEQAAYDLTRYLIDRGHRRIGMVAGLGGPQSVRIQGYQRALLEAGISPDIMADDAYSEVGGHRAAIALLARTPRPTAIFAANDLMAIGVLQALHEHAIEVPEQIAVAGFDDIPAASLVTPALTTVSQFQYAMGVTAAEVLLKRFEGPPTAGGTARSMPFELIERAST